MQTNDQSGNDQPPPQWFQAFVQQIVQTHNDQMNEVIQRINVIDQRTQAQGQPPSSVDQATPLPTSTTAPTPTDVSVSEEQPRRPRHKLPEMKMFTGKRSD